MDAAMTKELLGRWDVTVHNGESYPLWFELSENEGKIVGRIQPREGHAIPFESIDISGETLVLEVEDRSYRGALTEGGLEGTARAKDKTLKWTAVRAPVLGRVENPQWGDAIELFNGKDLSGWHPRHPSQTNLWKAIDGVLVNHGKGSDLVTDARFEDFTLHIEVKYPKGSNSGIYLRGRHEVQVQDDYGKEPHSRHMGGVYGQIDPTENAALPAGEWQTFDITLLGRWVTVTLNGKTIIDDREIPGITGGALDSREGEAGPLMLQGDHGEVSYRNIVITPREVGE
jgi:hypothetical protein